jgi:hypothetical protein
VLSKRDWLDLLVKDRCIPLTLLGVTSLPSSFNNRIGSAVESALFTLQRLYLLERRVRHAKIELDWTAL